MFEFLLKIVCWVELIFYFFDQLVDLVVIGRKIVDVYWYDGFGMRCNCFVYCFDREVEIFLVEVYEYWCSICMYNDVGIGVVGVCWNNDFIFWIYFLLVENDFYFGCLVVYGY